MTTTAPQPLGWCSWHIAVDEESPAITVYDGDTLCPGCSSVSLGADEDHEETAAEEHHRHVLSEAHFTDRSDG